MAARNGEFRSAILCTYVTVSFYHGRGGLPSDWLTRELRRIGAATPIVTHGANGRHGHFVRTHRIVSLSAVGWLPPRYISLTRFYGITRLKSDPAADGFNASKVGLRPPEGDAEHRFSSLSFRRHNQEQSNRRTPLAVDGTPLHFDARSTRFRALPQRGEFVPTRKFGPRPGDAWS